MYARCYTLSIKSNTKLLMKQISCVKVQLKENYTNTIMILK